MISEEINKNEKPEHGILTMLAALGVAVDASGVGVRAFGTAEAGAGTSDFSLLVRAFAALQDVGQAGGRCFFEPFSSHRAIVDPPEQIPLLDGLEPTQS